MGFIIDKLIGDQEILHKNLTPPLVRVRNVAGVTTIASGELCLILNVNDLIKTTFMMMGMGQKKIIPNREKQASLANHKRNILVVDDSVTYKNF
ncbi:MAG: chemotaxis protein CheW [Candidatus Moduliflexus flocculans]|nr:chemotaxis protein CheW [Candidatus Moduliflexus flocculans]